MTITYPDGGNFAMNIQNPFTNQFWTSKSISTNASAIDFANAISGYYGYAFGAWI